MYILPASITSSFMALRYWLVFLFIKSNHQARTTLQFTRMTMSTRLLFAECIGRKSRNL